MSLIQLSKQILPFLLVSSLSFAALSEEKKTAEIAKHLEPISDESWQEMIGPKVSDVYDIQKGDTLWDISKRLFGSSNYWPKVWALNDGITNPHIISPGRKLIFSPGDANSLPSLANINDTNTSESISSNEASNSEIATSSQTMPAGTQTNKVHEYDKVSQDLWKPITLEQQKISVNYDEYGIDKDIKIKPKTNDMFRIPAIANDTTIPYLGTVTGSQRDGVGLSQNEAIFIDSEGNDLQVGNSYVIFSEPTFITEEKSDRSGYVYYIKAEVKIIGIKDNAYIGIITYGFDPVFRGDHIYPVLPHIKEIKPVAASEAIEAAVILNPYTSAWSTSQYHFLHFDRGLEDGIQIGNVFRIYEYYDPITNEKLTDNDIIVNAEALIVHATAQFSTALVLRSRNTVTRGDFGVLLTDVSSLDKKIKDRSREFGKTQTSDTELDELDELDKNADDGIGVKEKQEIKELEKWDRTNNPEENKEAPIDQQLDETPTTQEQSPPAEPETATQSEPAPSFEGSEQAPPEPELKSEPMVPQESGSTEPSTDTNLEAPSSDAELDLPPP